MLDELFKQLVQHSSDSIVIAYDDVRKWSELDLHALVKSGLIKQANPATSLVCNGCEENCLMPVYIIPGSESAFIVCDRRDDTSKVNVQLDQLQQWQISQQSIVNFLYQALNDVSISHDQIKEKFKQLPLNKILTFRDRELLVDVPLLTSHIKPTVVYEKEIPAGNSLILKGDYWHISFNGKTKIIKNTLGIHYIEYLIRNKDKEVHVSKLFYAIKPPDENKVDKTYSEVPKENLEMEGLSVTYLNENNIGVDPDDKKYFLDRLKWLAIKIEEAVEDTDEEKQLRFENEQETILQQLNKDFGLKGKSRGTGSLAEQLRKNVTRCISRDRKNLSNTFPEFAAHLIFIKTGIFCSYNPNPDTEWQ